MCVCVCVNIIGKCFGVKREGESVFIVGFVLYSNVCVSRKIHMIELRERKHNFSLVFEKPHTAIHIHASIHTTTKQLPRFWPAVFPRDIGEGSDMVSHIYFELEPFRIGSSVVSGNHEDGERKFEVVPVGPPRLGWRRVSERD